MKLVEISSIVGKREANPGLVQDVGLQEAEE